MQTPRSNRRRVTGKRYLHAYATTIGKRTQQRHVKFDCDSKLIEIDNRCSACISPDIGDCIGKVTKSDKTIRGFGGKRVSDVYTGTISWSWYDDKGALHRLKIPHSYYVPDAEGRLLSPQHWAQAQARGSDDRNHYGEISYADKCVLFWKGSQLTVPMDKKHNVATFRTAAGYRKFDLYCQELKVEYDTSLRKPQIEKQ